MLKYLQEGVSDLFGASFLLPGFERTFLQENGENRVIRFFDFQCFFNPTCELFSFAVCIFLATPSLINSLNRPIVATNEMILCYCLVCFAF